MPWWGWIVLGVVLLGAELFVIPTDFFLVFLGCAAIAVGAVAWLGLGLSPALEWTLFAALAVGSLLLFRARVVARTRSEPAPRVDEALVGERGVAHVALAAGGSGSVELRGTHWSARNLEDTALEAGARVRVERVEGLTLCVRRDS